MKMPTPFLFVAALGALSFASRAGALCCNPDVDGSGIVDFTDLGLVSNCMEFGPPTAACDVNCDGVVNVGDLEIVYCWGNLLGGGVYGSPACCDTVGACCIGTECSDRTEPQCIAAGGLFQGNGTSCGGTAVSVVEPGGSVFIHQIVAPTECPVTRGAGRRGEPCDLGEMFLDPWVSPSGLSCHNFGVPGSPAIPADFFGPGSEPFTGQVCFTGTPSGNAFFPNADTIIQRTGGIGNICGLTEAPTYDIQIVELSLVSVAPISVVVNGVPEAWDVAVDLSSVAPPLGTLTTTRTHCNGGKYTSTLYVQPRFTFTKVSQPQHVQVLDTGLAGIPPVVLSPPEPNDWSIDLPPGIDGANYCTSFHPGFKTDVQVSCDCNENGIRDACDIDNGTSQDVNSNGIPDDCEGPISAPSIVPPSDAFALVPAMPNPTKSATNLVYILSRSERARVTIHDVRGRVVRTLVDELQTSGSHTVRWDGKDSLGKQVPASVYYARLTCEEGTLTTRIAVIK